MTLIVQDVAVEMILELRPLVAAIGRQDGDLARQIRRSASSVALNIAEGAHSRGGNEVNRYASAAGSASETRAALAVAEAWGYVSADACVKADALLDRVLAMLWGLTHRRRC